MAEVFYSQLQITKNKIIFNMIYNPFQARIKSQVSNSYATFCKNRMPKQQNCRNKLKINQILWKF